jgi:hypothetical protein
MALLADRPRHRLPHLEARMSTLEYREYNHTYFLDGAQVRSLSDVLQTAELELCRRFSLPVFGLVPDLRFVNEAVMQDKTAVGSQVDTVNSRLLEGTWTPEDEWQVSDRSLPYVLALEGYWAQTEKPSPVWVQTPLYCRELHFATMPDWHTENSVNDLKCGRNIQRTWGLRMAGQALAHGRATTERILHLEPQLKTRKWSVYERTNGHGDPRIFHFLDQAVVRCAALEDFSNPVFEEWKKRLRCAA